MFDISKCYKCGTSPEMHGYGNLHKIFCLKCGERATGTDRDLTISTWNVLQAEEAVKAKYQEAFNLLGQRLSNVEIFPRCSYRQKDSMRCVSCGAHPRLVYYSNLLDPANSTYEFICDTCHASSGRHIDIKFAENRWGEINMPKKEEMVFDHADLPRCKACGGCPTVNHHYPTYCDYGYYGYYEVGCKECQVWSGRKVTQALAEKTWCEMNPKTKMGNKLGDIMRGKRINPCKICGQEVLLRYDKGRHAYELGCLKCKNGCTAQEVTSVIFGWNELNPKSIGSDVCSGPKADTKPSLAPKPSYIFYEDRIAELHRAISDRLAWINETDGVNPKVVMDADWYKLEKWAKELAEMSKLRGDIQNG